jgi:hypothetical protein
VEWREFFSPAIPFVLWKNIFNISTKVALPLCCVLLSDPSLIYLMAKKFKEEAAPCPERRTCNPQMYYSLLKPCHDDFFLHRHYDIKEHLKHKLNDLNSKMFTA